MQVPEKTFNTLSSKCEEKMQKISSLISITLREMRKVVPASEMPASEISFEHLCELKRFYQINSLCLLEIFHELQLLGFSSVGIVLLKLFQSFKIQTTDMAKYTMMLFRSKGITFNSNENPLEEEATTIKPTNNQSKKRQSTVNSAGKYELTIDQMISLKELLKRHNASYELKFLSESPSDSKYATLERASFFLEQEKLELDQLLLTLNNSKDEITEFLNKKVNLDSINPSGVMKFLQNMFKENRVNSVNLSHLLESEKSELDKRKNVDESSDYQIDKIKTDMIEKIEKKTKKLIFTSITRDKNQRGNIFHQDREVQVSKFF